MISFIVFELAANQDCQKKLQDEINWQCEKSNGMLMYEDVQDMSYLDACFYG